MPEAWQHCILTGGALCEEEVSPPRQGLLHLVCVLLSPTTDCSACTLLSCLVLGPCQWQSWKCASGFPSRRQRSQGYGCKLGGRGRAARIGRVHGTQPAMCAVPLGLLPRPCLSLCSMLAPRNPCLWAMWWWGEMLCSGFIAASSAALAGRWCWSVPCVHAPFTLDWEHVQGRYVTLERLHVTAYLWMLFCCFSLPVAPLICRQWQLLQPSALSASWLLHIWRVKLPGVRRPAWQRQLVAEWQTELWIFPSPEGGDESFCSFVRLSLYHRAHWK